MAKLLRVPTGRVSFIPQTTSEGYLQLGYVETAKSDIVRDSLIGAAPIISGGLFIAYAAIFHLDLLPLWDVLRNGQVGLFILGLGLIPKVKDFLPWLYLTFAVSSTMLPSASDRYAWRPVGLWILVLLVLAILAGAGPWMLAYLAPWVNAFLRSAALVFGLSALVHLVLLLPFFLFHRVLTRLTGIDVGQ
ncbi:MAG: hypothetical protein JXA13_08435 [Anaerolineales bacterium]|nr:hypothetical protein [Anaerolineales bacterium]